MVQDPNTERLIRKAVKPLNEQINELRTELNALKQRMETQLKGDKDEELPNQANNHVRNT